MRTNKRGKKIKSLAWLVRIVVVIGPLWFIRYTEEHAHEAGTVVRKAVVYREPPVAIDLGGERLHSLVANLRMDVHVRGQSHYTAQ